MTGFVRDDAGVIHIEHRYVQPRLGQDNNVLEEDVVVTWCDVEVSVFWREAPGPSTCLACLGDRT